MAGPTVTAKLITMRRMAKPSLRFSSGSDRREMINADARKVRLSSQIANDSWSTWNRSRAAAKR